MFDDLFKVKVVIKCKKEALEEARKDKPGLVVWTDGSKLDQGQTVAAICWEDKLTGQWKDKSMYLGKNKEILDAELWAISEALSIASTRTKIGNTPITIFCDSQKALSTIALPYTSQGNRFLRNLICQKTRELQDNGNHCSFHWIPSHSGLMENEKADLAAKNRA